MERRELLTWMLATTGLECLHRLGPFDLLTLGAEVHADAAAGGRIFRVLDPHAERTVVVAAERIIPASETPGATDAGVSGFIDVMLSDWYTVAERDRFLAGLRALDERSRALGGRDFADCGEADQTTVLLAFDGEVTALRADPAGARPNDHWFAMLKYLTIWGYCTSEVAMRRTLRTWPRPTRYDGCAPLSPRPAVREG